MNSTLTLSPSIAERELRSATNTGFPPLSLWKEFLPFLFLIKVPSCMGPSSLSLYPVSPAFTI